MKSKIAAEILRTTPKDTRIFVRMYGDITERIHTLMEQKGLTQKELALRMGKSPSEINKWLKNPHNYTLRTLAKLQEVLGEPIINVPSFVVFSSCEMKLSKMTVFKNVVKDESSTYQKVVFQSDKPQLEPDKVA